MLQTEPDLSLLEEYTSNHSNADPTLINTIRNFLGRSDLQRTKGKQRLMLVCDNIKNLSLSEAYRMIDPNAFQEEYEEAQINGFWSKALNFIRVSLGLAPIILTWTALFVASSDYQADLREHPGDRIQPFLRLWQDGFHGTSGFTFSLTALLDVGLLCAFLAATIIALSMEYHARGKSNYFAEELQKVTKGLLKVVIVEGIAPITTDANMERVVEAFRIVIEELFRASQDVIKDASDAVVNSNANMETLLKSMISPLLVKLNNVTDIYNNLVDISMKLATSASAMPSSIDKQSVISASIASSLMSLNNTEQLMTQRIITTAQDMKAVSEKFGSAIGTMNSAAFQLERVGEQLTLIKSSDIQSMADQVSRIISTLADIEKQLADTTLGLQTAADTFTRKTRRGCISWLTGSFRN